jgi:hypothetical protein
VQDLPDKSLETVDRLEKLELSASSINCRIQLRVRLSIGLRNWNFQPAVSTVEYNCG